MTAMTSYGCTAKIIDHRDGTATLQIRCAGKLLHNKVHKNHKAAMATWRRWCD